MSLEEINHKGYVKFDWLAKLSTTYSELETFYSDQFQIDNLDNVVFNIKLELDSSGYLNLLVKKSNPAEASATIRVMIGDVKNQVKKNQVDVDDWKDLCHVIKCCAISNLTETEQFYNDDCYDTINYIYTLSITCEIFWNDRIRRSYLENNLYDELKKFYKSEELSDITIIVNQVKIPAHKIILSAHSPVFSRMLQSDMKEAKEGVINIEDLDSEIVLEMLNYCYKGQTKAGYNTEVALQLLKVADMYQILKLKEICVITLQENMSVDNVLSIINAADDHNAIELHETAIKFIVNHKKQVFASDEFESLFYAKQKLMLQVVRAVGDQ